ncbi:permease family protein [Microbacterium sp. AG790]|nr:permease family protein [Microbacterium sp. AG790]
MPATPSSAARPTPAEPIGALDRFFEITRRGSTIGGEIRGGLVTFVTMAYIVILNPIILSGKADIAGNELAFSAVGAATALTAGVMTILFGLITRLPFAFAAGLGINAFLAFSVIHEVTWPEAMALVMINGVIIVLLAATGLRKLIFDAVPVQLKLAITVAIGLFIAFIGFVNSGFVTATGSNSPPVGLGIGGSVASVPTLMFVLTLLATGVLVARKVKGGMLIGLVGGTVVSVIIEAIWHLGSATDHPGGWGLTIPALTGSPVSVPDLSLLGAVDFGFDVGKVGFVALVMLVFTLVFSNFFDAMGTMTGLAKEAGLADEKGDFPPHQVRARRRRRRRRRGRRDLLIVGHGVHRVGVRHRRGRPHGPRQRRHRARVPAGDVLHAPHLDRADRGRRRGPRDRRRDDDGAGQAHRPQRLQRAAAGVPDGVGHADDVLDRQRHRRGLHQLGGRAFALRQGAADQPPAVGGRRRLPDLLRPRPHPIPAGSLTPSPSGSAGGR